MYPLIKTFRSILKARLIGVMAACAVLAVVMVGVLAGITIWLTAALVNLDIGWLDTILPWGAGILTGVAGWFMLPSLTVLIAGFFQEKAIQRVERVYYPEATRRADLKFWPEIWHDARFTLWALFLNICVLPLYAFGIGVLISIALNSYLLGREFFESAAGYHIGKGPAKKLRKQRRKSVYIGGFFITIMTLLPFLNLFVPILAIVWMVHVYHQECKSSAVELQG